MASAPETTQTSTRRKTALDLVEEAKKRIVLLLICIFGLSYIMSLTSSSVWVNFPAAAAIIIFSRYITLDLDARRRTAACSKLSPVDQRRSVELQTLPLQKTNWRRKVNCPVVEAAIDQFTRHLVSEWVTDLWYSRITPDKDGPEELVQIMNGVLGEVSSHARDINLINLLTRDVINLICNHLELYRLSQAKIGKQELAKLSIDHRDKQLRVILASKDKLHPALFSVEAEHKVLQHLMTGLITSTFKPQDLQCSFFRYTVRELLACAVIRPVLNMANPGFINEKIESLVLSSANKADKEVAPSAPEAHISKPNGPPKPSTDQTSGSLDRSTVGVELVQVRHQSSKSASDEQIIKNANGILKKPDSSHANFLGGPDASMVDPSNKSLSHISNSVAHNVQITYSPTSMPSDSQDTIEKKTDSRNSGAEWARRLDAISRRKTQALAPEHFDNMWTKGRNYGKEKDADHVAKEVAHNRSLGANDTPQRSAVQSDYVIQNRTVNIDPKKVTAASHHQNTYSVKTLPIHTDHTGAMHSDITSYQERTEYFNPQEVEPDSDGSYPTEDDENNTVTGIDSPGTRVWDSKNKGIAAISNVRHPLEPSEFHFVGNNKKGHARHPRTIRTASGRKRSRSNSQKTPAWQEVERTPFLLGEGQDILYPLKKDSRAEELSYEPEVEIWGRIHSGTAASSSMSSISASESCNSSFISPEISLLADPFLKLRCEVLGADIVKSGSVTFAVYSIAVTDANNNSWTIKRRFRHFEDLHRRLKEFPEYNLSLPPKHFLSSGLDVPVIQERYKLLDKYLKKLLQISTISGSIEVWDFLSVDSQTYMFSDSLSIIQTLSVDLDDKPHEKSPKVQSLAEGTKTHLPQRGENLSCVGPYAVHMTKNNPELDKLNLRKKDADQNMGTNAQKEHSNFYKDNSGSDSDNRLHKNILASIQSDSPEQARLSGPTMKEKSQILETTADTTIPTEEVWVPPNLTVPVLNLVDVVFQLQDGGWIRRQAFWVAKQLLQLGMGDAFDDWLIEKIQLLRKGAVIASVINRIEKILWPDGIFLTKHPNRKPQTPVSSPGSQKNSQKENTVTSDQQPEAVRRAKVVHELIIDKAPVALVSLVGRKEYEQCAQDVYFFLQSPVFLKQLAFELLELILLSAFPELDDVVRQLHEEKQKFGVVEYDR